MDRYARAVHHHALRLTGDRSEAEEAVSEREELRLPRFARVHQGRVQGRHDRHPDGVDAVMERAVTDRYGEGPARNGG